MKKNIRYDDWRNVVPVIEKAKESCKHSRNEIQDHFPKVRKMVKPGSGSKRKVEDFIQGWRQIAALLPELQKRKRLRAK